MDWLRQLRFRLLGLIRRQNLEAEMAEEMHAHLEREEAAQQVQTKAPNTKLDRDMGECAATKSLRAASQYSPCAPLSLETEYFV